MLCKKTWKRAGNTKRYSRLLKAAASLISFITYYCLSLGSVNPSTNLKVCPICKAKHVLGKGHISQEEEVYLLSCLSCTSSRCCFVIFLLFHSPSAKSSVLILEGWWYSVCVCVFVWINKLVLNNGIMLKPVPTSAPYGRLSLKNNPNISNQLIH